MNGRRQSVEALVGILVILGILAIGFLFLKFGKIRGTLQEYYNLTIEVNDATGIREGVPVRLGGLLIGQVSDVPILNRDFSAMEIPIEIRIEVKIPISSRVSIGSSGLMGDNYVKFTLPSQPSNEFIEPGSSLKASPDTGLKAIQNDAESVLANVNQSVSELNNTIESLDRIFTRIEGILGDDDDAAKLKTAISELSEMATTVNQASKKLDPLLGSADNVIRDFQETANVLQNSTGKLDPLFSSAEHTLTKVQKAADTTQDVVEGAGKTLESGSGAIQDLANVLGSAEPTLAEIQSVLQSFRETLAKVDHFADETEDNNGLLKALRDDPELKTDFKKLVDKLERNGIIFYPREKERTGPLRNLNSRRN